MMYYPGTPNKLPKNLAHFIYTSQVGVFPISQCWIQCNTFYESWSILRGFPPIPIDVYYYYSILVVWTGFQTRFGAFKHLLGANWEFDVMYDLYVIQVALCCLGIFGCCLGVRDSYLCYEVTLNLGFKLSEICFVNMSKLRLKTFLIHHNSVEYYSFMQSLDFCCECIMLKTLFIYSVHCFFMIIDTFYFKIYG